MIDESKQDLLVQYLLNELDSSTAEKISAELEVNSELREFVRQTEDAFASIACLWPPMEAPAGLPQRIIQLEGSVSKAPIPTPRANIVRLVFPWALAACLAVACALLGLERTRLEKQTEKVRQELLALQKKNVQIEEELAMLQKKNVQIEEELAMLQKKNVLAELKIATLKAQVAAYRSASAVVVWDKNQKSGVLQLDRLPPPGSGKDYQLWVIDPKITQPVSAGVLAVPNNGLIRTSFRPATPIESASAFAISIEKAGGALKPEGQIILVGK
ncbi:MAG: anti-sigma factor [Verrucomicrobia bacterium]|nr:anti-sigma factor [Verrucomicrobiota bacterium]MBV9644774.1 anti-sigma factor [Verrucomicrobiota bacterium]